MGCFGKIIGEIIVVTRKSRGICVLSQMALSLSLSRERLAGDNESKFLRSTKAQRPISLKEHTVQLDIARKKHPNRR